MSTTHDDATDDGSTNRIGFRAPRRLRERIEERVESEDEHDTRSDVIREAVRRYCLRAEVEERLDDDAIGGGAT